MKLRIISNFLLILNTWVAGFTGQNNDLSELIIDYVEYKNVSNSMSAFLCLRGFDALSLSRKLMNASIRSAILNPNTKFYESETMPDLLHRNYHNLNVVADLRCENIEDLMTELSINQMFSHLYAWLLISDNKTEAFELMSKLNLSVDADVVVAVVFDEETILYDIYNTGSDRNGIFKTTVIGTWRISDRLNISEMQSFVYRRKNLTGITLKFAAVTAYMDANELDVIKYLSNNDNKTYDNIAKFNYALSIVPRDFFNYSVEISTWIDYGGRWDGRPFFGMMGALGRQEADFTLGGTVITKERLEYCTVIVQNYPFWTGFLFRHPPSHSIRNVFLEPLVPSAWNAVLAISILVIMMLTLTAYYNEKDDNPWSFGIYATLSTLFQQGWSSSPLRLSGRILFFVFMIFSMLLYNFYSASVVSSLLSDSPQNIRTIADLLINGMPAAYENVSYVPHYFEISTIQAEKNFYKKRLLDNGKPRVLPRPEGIRRVKAGGFAYHTNPADVYEDIAREFTQSEICRLAEITFIRKSILALWASRDNPYSEHLRVLHRRLEEVGILAREQRRWFVPKPRCLGGTTTLNSIGLPDVAPAFLGLFIGALASIFILIIEVVHHLLKKQRAVESLYHRSKKFIEKKKIRNK